MSWFRRNLIVLRSGTPGGVLALTGIGQNLSLVLPAALFPFWRTCVSPAAIRRYVLYFEGLKGRQRRSPGISELFLARKFERPRRFQRGH